MQTTLTARVASIVRGPNSGIVDVVGVGGSGVAVESAVEDAVGAAVGFAVGAVVGVAMGGVGVGLGVDGFALGAWALGCVRKGV